MYAARLRCNDLGRLQTATTSFVSAMNPTKRSSQIRIFSSRNASVGRSRNSSVPFISDFVRVEIRSVANEELFLGNTIPIRGRFSLLRHALTKRSALPLAILSGILILASAALFALSPGTGWWDWSEQLAGRLATGSFGALLVDGAIEYTALRQALMAGSGPVTHGAMIDWKRK